jgi:hypothetical protein
LYSSRTTNIAGQSSGIAHLEVPHRNLSPDGTSIALLEGSEGRIRILPLTGQQPQEVVVKGWDSIQTMDWAADGYRITEKVIWHVVKKSAARAGVLNLAPMIVAGRVRVCAMPPGAN